MKQEIELLAPAGSYEALIAAIQNGANAVYLGGNQFSARASATNFSNEEIKEAVEYAHLRNVKIYVTVNILYKDSDFEALHTYISFLYSNHVDAIIVQDVGVLSLIKTYFPDFEIHMSTQASIYQLAGVQYFEKQGIKRVVLARENTLEEIQHICKNTSVDIEVFVHGALCVAYSGQCLMSSFIGKRSGNKGACAQPCRLGYTLSMDNKKISSKANFLLSPKDLCTIENIGDLILAGVTSFKIEGRMKRPEYVATIVKSYREAIDAHLKNEKPRHQDRILNMKKMFNRGFTKGYLFHDAKFMAKEFPGNRGVMVGKVAHYNSKTKRASIKLQAPLKQNDRIVFGNKDLTRTITKLYYNKQLINEGKIGDHIEIEMNEKVTNEDLIYKVVDSKLLDSAKNSYAHENIKIPIDMQFSGSVGSVCKLTLSDRKNTVTVTSEELVETALQQPITTKRIQQQLQKLGSTIYEAKEITVQFDSNGSISIKSLNSLRRNGIALLDQARTKRSAIKSVSFSKIQDSTKHSIKGIAIRVTTLEQLTIALEYPSSHIFYPINKMLSKAISLAKDKGKTIIPYTGFMLEQNVLLDFIKSPTYSLVDTILVGNYGALQLFKDDKKCILDSNMNIYNSYAGKYLEDYNFICSVEMSKKQARHLQVKQEIFYTVYGHIESMVSKHCPISEEKYQKKVIGCNACKAGNYSLIDRKNEKFPIYMDDSCYLHLYNNKPLYIDDIRGLSTDYILLTLTIENSEITKNILDDYFHWIIHNKKSHYKTNGFYTNGYYLE